MRKNTISFGYRIFNEIDCCELLGRLAAIQRGYQPIQINVVNNTDRHLLLSSANFSVSCQSYFEVAEKAQFFVYNRVLTWVLSSFIVDSFRHGKLSQEFISLMHISSYSYNMALLPSEITLQRGLLKNQKI